MVYLHLLIESFLPLILSVVVGVFVYFIMIMYIYWEHPAYLFEIPYMKTLYYKIKRIMKNKRFLKYKIVFKSNF